MRSRLLPGVLGCMGLALVTPLLAVMGWVVAHEDAAKLPSGPDAVEGDIVSPATGQGPIGAPFVFGRVRTYATYDRGGRRMYGSVSYIDEDRGNPRVTLQTATGQVEVTLGDPMTSWRNTTNESSSYTSPAQVPGWQPQWRLPSNLRQIVVYVLAVRTGQRLLVERATDGSARVAWIGGRAASEAALSRQGQVQKTFSLGSYVASGLCALLSLALVAVAFLRKSRS